MSVINAKYTKAGHVILPEGHVGIRNNVYLPGGLYTAELQEDGFHAPDRALIRNKREKRILRTGVAAFILGVVLVVFVVIIAGKLIKGGRLVNEINMSAAAVTAHLQTLHESEAELAEKSDKMSICYRAVQEYGMITTSGAESYTIRFDPVAGGVVAAPTSAYGYEARASR